MATVSTRQLIRLAGIPTRGVLWGIYKRHEDKLQGALLHVQRRRGGSLWRAECVDTFRRIWESQRPHYPWRQSKARPETQLKHLAKLNPAQRAALEAKIVNLEAEWLKETDERRRIALEADLRFLRRVKNRDDKKAK